jgi:hypothetical protein
MPLSYGTGPRRRDRRLGLAGLLPDLRPRGSAELAQPAWPGAELAQSDSELAQALIGGAPARGPRAPAWRAASSAPMGGSTATWRARAVRAEQLDQASPSWRGRGAELAQIRYRAGAYQVPS